MRLPPLRTPTATRALLIGTTTACTSSAERMEQSCRLACPVFDGISGRRKTRRRSDAAGRDFRPPQ